MTRFFSVLALVVLMTLRLAPAADAAEPIRLADGAPQRYVVVRGDTLWDISGRFLKEPWRWPEIWRMNRDQIKNPHRIYPGDVIVLERDATGQPYLRLESKLRPQIHAEQENEAIPPIPPNVIEPFIAKPLIIEENGLESAAKIVATAQDRVFLSKGDMAFVKGADAKQKRWQVFRNGEPLRDPEDPKRVLGYEAFELGTAIQTRPGDPAIFQIETAKQEIGTGDRLLPAERPVLIDYVPHVPDQQVDGRVVSVYGGVGSGGRLSIVAISRGHADGIEIGHILALEQNRTVIARDEKDEKSEVVIPALRFGLMIVFRTFEHISYALVVQSDGTIDAGDFVRTP